MKSLISLALTVAMLAVPAIIATPAQARSMADCLTTQSATYCAAALGTASLMSVGHEPACPAGDRMVVTGPNDIDYYCVCVK